MALTMRTGADVRAIATELQQYGYVFVELADGAFGLYADEQTGDGNVGTYTTLRSAVRKAHGMLTGRQS